MWFLIKDFLYIFCCYRINYRVKLVEMGEINSKEILWSVVVKGSYFVGKLRIYLVFEAGWRGCVDFFFVLIR